jgi:hypothetical protein
MADCTQCGLQIDSAREIAGKDTCIECAEFYLNTERRGCPLCYAVYAYMHTDKCTTCNVDLIIQST